MSCNEESVSHLSSGFSFSISSEELRGNFRNRSFVGTGRSGSRVQLGKTARGQLGRRHVLI